MSNKIQEIKWKLHCKKSRYLTIWGLKNKHVSLYSDKLIKKLRNIYYGGLPASIILLSKSLCNGNCYDRATLLAQAFLDEDVDINLIYATIDSLRLNPKNIDKGYSGDHCFLEVITKNGQRYIFDTSKGLVYDKELYWKIERPRVRKINGKKAIEEFVNSEEYYNPKNLEEDKYMAPLILEMLETTKQKSLEIYSQDGIELLQREIEEYKKQINYDKLCQEIDKKMKKHGIRN